MNPTQTRVARVAAVLAATALVLPVAGVAEAAHRPAAGRTVAVKSPAAKTAAARTAAAQRAAAQRAAAKAAAARTAAAKAAAAKAAAAKAKAEAAARPAPAGASSAPQLVTPPAAPVLPALHDALVPAGLAADCSADVSGALNAWLAGLPTSGVRVLFPEGACFRAERDVTVTGKSGWVVEGRGATLRRTQATPAELRYPKNNRHFSVVRSSDVVVRGLAVQGLNTTSDVPHNPALGAYVRDQEFEHGFSLWDSRRVLLEDLQTSATFGDGVYLHSDVSDVTLRATRVARNGRQAVAVLADRVLADGVTVAGSRRAGFDLEPDTPAGGITDVEIRNSTISSHLLAFASKGQGAVDRVHIHHNTVLATGVPFVYAHSEGHTRDDWTVAHNWVRPVLGSPSAAMRFVNADRVTVTGNALAVVSTQSRRVFEVGQGSTITSTCNVYRGARADFVEDWGGPRSTIASTGDALTAVPAPCFDRAAVGAPAAAATPRPQDDFAAATAVPALAPGAATAAVEVDNREYGVEADEEAPHAASGRSAWFSYTTGRTAETLEVRLTGGLRSVKVVTGPSLWYQVPVAEHYDTQRFTVTLEPSTTYRFRIDGCTYPGPTGTGTVTFVRGSGGNDDVAAATVVDRLGAGASRSWAADNRSATALPEEAGCPVNCHGRSLWWRYDVDRAHRLQVTTTGAFNSLSVSRGASGPERVVGQTPYARELGVDVTPGTYWVRVDSSSYGGNAPGAGTVRLTALG